MVSSGETKEKTEVEKDLKLQALFTLHRKGSNSFSLVMCFRPSRQ